MFLYRDVSLSFKLSGVCLCIVTFERERGFQCICVCLYVEYVCVCVIFEQRG